MASARTPGHLAETNISAVFKQAVGAFRGRTEHGLQYRKLATGTVQLTAGTGGGAATYNIKIGGVSISGTVAFNTSLNQTATDLATAINAAKATNAAAGLYVVATVSTDTVTVRQYKGGALGALATTVGGDGTTTDTDFSGDTNTWTEHVSGATFDGDAYYELWWDPSDIPDMVDADGNTVDMADAMLLDLKLQTAAQTFLLWSGDIRMASNAIVNAGPAFAAAAWKTIEWLDAGYPVLIKLAADDTLYVEARYI